MHSFFVIYDNRTNLELGIKVESRPAKPAPEKDLDIIKVPGGKTLYIEKGYKDIEIPIAFNFVNRNWDETFRIAKDWLLNAKDKILKFSDDLGFLYKVNNVVIQTPERILKNCGKFEVIFICDPYLYSSEEETVLTNIIYNSNVLSMPIYRIVGEGLLTLTINNKNIKVNVGQELIIDTDKGLCYRNGIVNNVALQGRYEDMYLQEGENNFSWTNGFDIYIKKNMRCL